MTVQEQDRYIRAVAAIVAAKPNETIPPWAIADFDRFKPRRAARSDTRNTGASIAAMVREFLAVPERGGTYGD